MMKFLSKNENFEKFPKIDLEMSKPENGSKVESGIEHHEPTHLIMDQTSWPMETPLGTVDEEREGQGFFPCPTLLQVKSLGVFLSFK